jgi:hypothetical protein
LLARGLRRCCDGWFVVTAQAAARRFAFPDGRNMSGGRCQSEDGHVPVHGLVLPGVYQKCLVENANAAIGTNGFVKFSPRICVSRLNRAKKCVNVAKKCVNTLFLVSKLSML